MKKRISLRRAHLGCLAGVAALALTASACGSDDSSSSSASSKQTASSATGDATAAGNELFAGSETPPPSSGPAAQKGKTVWWISCGQAAPACSVPAQAASDAAKTLGYNFKIADGKLNIGGGYATAIRQAVAAKPDAIVVHAMNCELVKQPLAEAKAAGIKTFDVEAGPCPDGTSPYTDNMQYSSKAPTSTDYFQNWGALSARYIAASNPNAKVIDNFEDDDLGTQIQAGFTRELAKCAGCKIVKTVKYQVSDLTPNGAWIQAFRTALLQSDANVAFLPFGVQMLGVGGIKAIKESGKKIEVVGGNGESDAMDFVRSGDVAACTGCHDSSWMAYGVMDNVNRVLSGGKPVPQGIGQRVVDKAHASQASAGEGKPYRSPIDWKAAYEKVWSGSGS